MLQQAEVRADGVKLNMMSGPVAGPPLLLLHGVTRRWQTFAPILPSLALRWHVHAIDFLGHGESARSSGGYFVADYVQTAVAFVQERFAEPVVVYGHSLGAMVAAGVAARLPERVKSLVMEDPPFDTMGRRIGETPLRSYFDQLRALAGSTRPISDVVRDLAEIQLIPPTGGAAQRLGDVRDEASLRFTAASLAKLDPRALDPVVAGQWLDGFDWSGTLAAVSSPALLVQADPAVGGMLIESDAARARAALKEGCRVSLKGVGHLIHGTKPAELMTVIIPFLESL